MIAGRLFYIAP